jgi:hypothetical protein
MSKYIEIIKLFTYCSDIGIRCTLLPLYDGYKILFRNGGDVVQHSGSYGGTCGCVEPNIGSRLDYTAVSLKNAKLLVRRHKEKLNGDLKRSDIQ